MNREDILYQIFYSYRLEQMFSTLTSRIDKSLSFALILLGSSVIGNFGYPVVTGLLIAGISSVKMAFHFESAAEHSRKQASDYLKLFNTQKMIESDADLLAAMTRIQDNDRAPWSVLIYPAMVSTQLELKKTPTSRLNFVEKVLAKASGAIVSGRAD